MFLRRRSRVGSSQNGLLIPEFGAKHPGWHGAGLNVFGRLTQRYARPVRHQNTCNAADTLMDVCAKLKYVRSIAVSTDTNFSCPRDTSSLVGLPANRIRSMWGEPNFVEGATSPNRTGSGTRWTYFMGSPKPGQVGGGFPVLSLRLVDGTVGSVSCALSM